MTPTFIMKHLKEKGIKNGFCNNWRNLSSGPIYMWYPLLADLKEKASEIEAKWQSERETIAKIRNIKEKIEKAKFEVERAQNSGELQKVAELKYGEVPTL